MAWAALAAAGLLACAGCRRTPAQPETPAGKPLTEVFSADGVECRVTAEPGEVRLERDLLLTIRIQTPEGVEARLPPIESRLQGFAVNGAYTREPAVADGFAAREHCFMLSPTLDEEHRLGPMAILYTDRRGETHKEGWFQTRPIAFKRAEHPTPGSPADILGPRHIYPPFSTVMLWLGLALAAAAALAALVLAVRRWRRAVRLRRMSPKERALHELAELMARDLIARQQVKEFYLGITLIVRRYIERAHAVRAPEQTTEEFLDAIARDARFSGETARKLSVFLESADLVKFAVFRPDATAVDRAVATARDYIETDEEEQRTKADV